MEDHHRKNETEENLNSVDIRMEEALTEIELIQESRKKDFRGIHGRKDILPLHHIPRDIKDYKIKRINKVASVEKLGIQVNFEQEYVDFVQEIDHFWHLEEYFSPRNLIDIVKSAFETRIREIVQENAMLKSRWIRYSIMTNEIMIWQTLFETRQSKLHMDYKDYVERYERVLLSLEKIIEREKSSDLNAHLMERDLAWDPDKENFVQLYERKNINLMETELAVGDLAIYLRYIIQKMTYNKPVQLFLKRLQSLIVTNKNAILEEFEKLSQLKHGESLDSIQSFYDGVENYASCTPMKKIPLEDFFSEFDNLILLGGIKTPIGREDGRPFAFEISKYMEDKVRHLAHEWHPEEDEDILEKTNRVEVVKIPCPWHEQFGMYEKNDPDYCDYLKCLAGLKEIDFETQYQMELLKLNDLENIKDQLNDQYRNFLDAPSPYDSIGGGGAHSAHIKAKSLRSSMTINSNSSTSGGNSGNKEEHVTAPQTNKRFQTHFHFGMLLPIYDVHEFQCNILDTRKQDFAKALRNTENMKVIYEDIKKVDSERAKTVAIPPDPTVTTVFSHHEIVAFSQLRYTLTRLLRHKILRQFNYLQSIAKRVWRDLHRLNVKKPIDADLDFSEETQDFLTDDVYKFSKQGIYVFSHSGEERVYESAFLEMEKWEQDSLKILTAYINVSNREFIPSYKEEMLMRRGKRTNLGNITFLNKNVDRSQMLLEFFEHEKEFNNAKINVINLIMDVYENTVNPDDTLKLAQLLLTLIRRRPRFNFERKYFSFDYKFETKALENQSNFLSSFMNYMIEKSHQVKTELSAKINAMSNNAMHEDQYDITLMTGLSNDPDSPKPTCNFFSNVTKYLIAEFVPGLSNIWDISQELRKQQSKFNTIINFHHHENQSSYKMPDHVLECVLWRYATTMWETMMSKDFRMKANIKRINFVDETWITNPLLPDLILSDAYEAFSMKNGKDDYSSAGISPYTPFNDPKFEQQGLNSLHRLIHLIHFRSALEMSYFERMLWENCLKVFTRVLTCGSNEVGEQPKKLDFEDVEMLMDITQKEGQTEDVGGIGHFDNMDDMHKMTTDVDPKFFPEIDELEYQKYDGADFKLDYGSYSLVSSELQLINMTRLKTLYKSELIGFMKNRTYATSIWLIMLDSVKDRSSFLNNNKNKWTLREAAENFILSIRENVDQVFQDSFHMMIKEYVSGIINVHDSVNRSLTKFEKFEAHLGRVKPSVFDTFAKTEAAKVFLKIRTEVKMASHLKLVFVNTPITSFEEIYIQKDSSDGNNNQNAQHHSHTQKDMKLMTITDKSSVVGKLWYLPHVTEVFSTKPIDDLANNNSNHKYVDREQEFSYKLLYLASFMCAVVHVISDLGMIAHCMDKDFGGTTRKMREIDFFMNALNLIKKELEAFGSPVEFDDIVETTNRIKRILLLRLGSVLTEAAYSSGIVGQSQHVLFRALGIRQKLQHQLPFRTTDLLAAIDDNSKRCMLEVSLRQQADFEDLLQNQGFELSSTTEIQKAVYLTQTVSLALLRMELMNLALGKTQIEKETEIEEWKRVYSHLVLENVASKYHSKSTKEKGIEVTAATLMGAIDLKGNTRSVIDFRSKMAIDQLQIQVLREVLMFYYTKEELSSVLTLLASLKDERSRKLFSATRNKIQVPGIRKDVTGSTEVLLNHHSYKSDLLLKFVSKLHASHAQSVKTLSVAHKMLAEYINQMDYLVVPKEEFNDLTLQLGLQLSRFGATRVEESIAFDSTQDQKVLDSFSEKNKEIKQLQSKLDSFKEEFDIAVAVMATKYASHIATETAALSVEVAQLKQSQKIDEKKLRFAMTEEYESLVKELVNEIHVLSNRFNEFRTNVVKQVLDIISESKLEEVEGVMMRGDVPEILKEKALEEVQHENQLKALRDDNHELKMTLVKIRSMYTIKEQALRSSLDKKIRRLADDNRRAETKLWTSFKEGEAREKTMKSQLNQTQKALASAELDIERLKKAQANKTTSDGNSVNIVLAQLKAEVEKYRKMNVEGMKKELDEKTKILEQLLQEREALIKRAGTDNHRTSVMQQTISSKIPGLLPPTSAEKRPSTVRSVPKQTPTPAVLDTSITLSALSKSNTRLKSVSSVGRSSASFNASDSSNRPSSISGKSSSSSMSKK